MARTVVVTGANSGIGLATTLDLAAHGYDVIGTVRSPDKAAALRDEALARGAVVRSVVVELTDADDVKRAWTEIGAMTGGGPWALVNNAGYAQPGAVEDVSDDLAREQLDVNVIAPMRLVRLALPAMRERRGGCIVNVSSIAGRVSLPMMGWYHASKHALEALTDSLRMEVAAYGIRVTLVEPGSFASNIWETGLSRLPDVDSSPYRDGYRRATSVPTNVDTLPDPVWVARTIRLALTSPLPLRRYLVGADAMVGSLLDSLLPDAVTDYAKRVGSGLQPLPFRR